MGGWLERLDQAGPVWDAVCTLNIQSSEYRPRKGILCELAEVQSQTPELQNRPWRVELRPGFSEQDSATLQRLNIRKPSREATENKASSKRV